MSKGTSLLRFVEELLGRFERVAWYLKGVDKKSFMGNSMLQDAVIHNIAIAGEICNNIDKHHEEFAKHAADANLLGLIATRNVLIHRYHAVDLDMIWTAAFEEFPKLRDDLKKAIDNYKP